MIQKRINELILTVTTNQRVRLMVSNYEPRVGRQMMRDSRKQNTIRDMAPIEARMTNWTVTSHAKRANPPSDTCSSHSGAR